MTNSCLTWLPFSWILKTSYFQKVSHLVHCRSFVAIYNSNVQPVQSFPGSSWPFQKSPILEKQHASLFHCHLFFHSLQLEKNILPIPYIENRIERHPNILVFFSRVVNNRVHPMGLSLKCCSLSISIKSKISQRAFAYFKEIEKSPKRPCWRP